MRLTSLTREPENSRLDLDNGVTLGYFCEGNDKTVRSSKQNWYELKPFAPIGLP